MEAPRFEFDPDDIIIGISPLSQDAQEAFRHPHNIPLRLLKNQAPSLQPPQQEPQDVGHQAPEVTLALRFSRYSNDPKGFVFGSDDKDCDVLLPFQGGISRTHFFIQFDWDSKVVQLTDTSSKGTRIKSNVYGEHMLHGTYLPLNTGDTIQAGLV